ncbi:protein nervous wreck isoform X3 [Aethina tumida]|uniref:protein nervous wreck isoform X3 n=1 Tax=Aethina tumida TaxID=116153 RepID=UPI002147AEF4|nr:protein nervous wreck isoform X3 [Aethina tumida]
MQPPPRKGNYVKFLKNLHSEQINKLLLKNQHECDLLEDLRTFIIKRSAIEKSYSEALLKISSAYLNKKIPNIPDIKLDGGEEKWNMWSVWRTVLEENEKLARARLAAVEVFQQQLADDAKILRSHKIQTAKRCVDQLAIVQKELQTCVLDVDKTKKFYFDEEHSAHDVRDKARDIEEKLKKKKGSFFQSITSLQKNSAKFSTKRELLEEKSTGARNDYLLCLAAANAHQNRYFVVDLQLCMTSMESGVYDKVAEYLTLMGRTELLTCSAMQNSFTIIRDQAKKLTREYNLQCCYLYYPVLKQHIQYEFEPCDNDTQDHISADHDSAAATLSKEARRWATKIARENNTIKESVRKLQIYNALREAGQKVDPNDQNGPDLETKIDDLKQTIRRSETSKAKAEARIECLRAGGVNVDEWLQEAETLNVQDIQRSASSLSDHPSSDSFYDSDFADGEVTAAPVAASVTGDRTSERGVDFEEQPQDYYEAAEVDGEWAVLEQERQRIEQLTAGWDDPTQVDWGAEAARNGSESADAPETVPSGPLLKCTALYSYTAQNPDELTIVENEQLEVVGEGDGDGWLRARNYKGEEGYVPHNYLDIEREQSVTTPGLVNQISFSSVDYTVDNEDEALQQSETNQSPEQISVISLPMQQTPKSDEPPSEYCMALYDYDGEGDEELTFEEGQIIRILSRCAHSVDDGWWKGELEGRVGNFPSLVVEECDEYGEPLPGEFDESPPPSAPPVTTPPDLPNFLVAPAEVVITQATPIGDRPQQKEEEDADDEGDGEPGARTERGFSMELTRDQQKHYGSQFGEDGTAVPRREGDSAGRSGATARRRLRPGCGADRDNGRDTDD